MSIFTKIGSVIGSVGGVIGKVIGVAGTVIAVAKPIVYALKDAIPEVGKALGFIQDKLEAGQVEADDFLDRNLPVINALEAVSARGVDVMDRLHTISVKLRVYSQEQTPDRITEDEAADLIQEFKALVALLNPWHEDLTAAADLMAKMEAEG